MVKAAEEATPMVNRAQTHILNKTAILMPNKAPIRTHRPANMIVAITQDLTEETGLPVSRGTPRDVLLESD